MKIGRNDHCPCGSGKKYKKCHLGRMYSQYENPKIPPNVIEAANRFRKPPLESFEKGGFLLGRPFIDTVFKNKRVRAVGSKVYMRPIGETFHEFILDLFGKAIGYDWITEERAKKDEHRHPLSFWGQEMVEKMVEKKNQRLDQSIPFGVKQSGNIRTLLALAYDYYSLCHCSAAIQPNFIKRLKNKNSFQGARYEMAVAGIAVRAGFEITWINEKSKHCEFKGGHTRTDDMSLFECKSHHRSGILGQGGIFDSNNARVKILDHFNEAVEQSDKNLPLIIFDDINLPSTPDIDFEQKHWVKAIDDSFKKFNFYEQQKQTNYGALFITNFSWYYHSDLDNLKSNEVIAYFHINGKYSLKPETISLLKSAAEQYGFVPNKLEEFAAKGKM